MRAGLLEFCGWTCIPTEWRRISGLRRIEDLVEAVFGVQPRRWMDIDDYNSSSWGDDGATTIQYRPMDFYGGRGCGIWQHSASALRWGMDDYTRMVRYVSASEVISNEDYWKLVQQEIALADSGDMRNCFCDEKLIYFLQKVRLGGCCHKAQEKVLGLGAVELNLWQIGVIDHISMPFIESKGFTQEMVFSEDENEVGVVRPRDDTAEEVYYARYEGNEYNEDRKRDGGLGIVRLLMRREMGFAPRREDTRSYAALYYQRVEDLWIRGQEERGE